MSALGYASRNLFEEEIVYLESHGCWAEDWDNVIVDVAGFHCEAVIACTFRGKVTLGQMDENSYLMRSTLENVYVGDFFRISDVGLLSGYTIADHFYASSCAVISASNGATFGIGMPVSVVNEGGGRVVPLSAHLTSNIAYMVAMHGYRGDLIGAYSKLVEEEEALTMSTIGSAVEIVGVSRVEDVIIGDCVAIRGVTSLVNGTILSEDICPTRIEDGVMMRNFVVAEGAHIFGGAHLTNVFIGECAEVGAGFTADNLLAFANCQLLCGEAVAALAGPFTVSHHKTTLLIAAAYSFFNAGSATNASNHHYRLGPLHQAVYDRGVKTGSGSYVLEPAHIGAFTMVVGHHKTNADTSLFPFSILAERDGESHLLVAQNLKSIGLFRDSRKWEQRDKRQESISHDKYSTQALSPMTVQMMLKAIDFIDAKVEGSTADTFLVSGVRIKKGLLERARTAYDDAVRLYLLHVYLSGDVHAASELTVGDDWCDLGGLIAPTAEVRKIEDALLRGDYSSVEELAKAIDELSERAEELTKAWVARKVRELFPNWEDRAALEQSYAALRKDFAEAMEADARKEWGSKLSVSYGLDGSADDARADYLRIKGDPEECDDIRSCRDMETF